MSNNAVYGITLKAYGTGFVGTIDLAQERLKQLGIVGKQAGDQISVGANTGRVGIDASAAAIERITGKMALMGHAGIAMWGVSQIGNYAASLIDAATSMDRFNSSIAIASGSSKNAAGEFEHVRALSNRLGLEMMMTANAYASFSAAARGTSLEGQKARDVFDSVAGVTAKMGLNGEQSQGVFLALSQMMSKGVVSAEEFRQQLGERLPIATEAGARAMKVSTAECLPHARGGVSVKNGLFYHPRGSSPRPWGCFRVGVSSV